MSALCLNVPHAATVAIGRMARLPGLHRVKVSTGSRAFRSWCGRTHNQLRDPKSLRKPIFGTEDEFLWFMMGIEGREGVHGTGLVG